jgi:glycosyltransferase involved in cell wall biosynthesis
VKASDPVVSVVIATYNRNYVLCHAIRSVLDSTLRDLEVIVVGDHCTDDTAEAVAAIGDPRIRFVNLPEHRGDQSGPNNRGLELARGRIVAFLNHDDLYFPQHLTAGVERLEQAEADFLWSATLIAEPASEQTLERRAWPVSVGSTPPAGIFDPLVFCVASSWIFKRELVDRVGPWRSGSELYVMPSQDWMFRVWRSGARMVFHPRVSVLVLKSGPRKNSYRLRYSPEHDLYAKEIRENPRFREDLLESAALTEAAARAASGRDQLFRHARRMLSAPLRSLCVRFGLHPASVYVILFGPRRRGGVIDIHRRRVGLEPVARAASRR